MWPCGGEDRDRLELVAVPEDSSSFPFLLILWRSGKIRGHSGKYMWEPVETSG